MRLALLDTHLPPQKAQEALIDILPSWIDEDDQGEQQETGDYLVKVPGRGPSVESAAVSTGFKGYVENDDGRIGYMG